MPRKVPSWVHKMARDQSQLQSNRTKQERSNIAIKGEAARHKKEVKIAKLKFLGKDDA